MAVIEAIATTYLEANTASVTFSSIPATYEHLELRMSVMNDVTGSAYYYFRLNSDTSSVYSNQRMTGTSSTVVGASSAGQSYLMAQYLPTIDEGAANYGVLVATYLDYANANKNTTVLWTNGSVIPATSVGISVWDDTEAVDEILIYCDNEWQRGSSFTLYGLNSA